MLKPEKTLRILMIAPTPYFSDRGCHVRIFEEAQALMELGHEVRIVSYHLGRDIAPVPVDRIGSVPWYRKHDAGPSWHKPYLDLLLFLKARRVAASFKPHLIHGHLHEGALIGWCIARLIKAPLVFDYQGSLSGESLNHGFFRGGSLLHRLFQTVERRINRLADLVITSSTPGALELTGQWRLPQERVVPFPDGVDTRMFRHRSRNEARRRLGLPEELPVIVYLGLLNGYQGTDLLLEAASLLVQRRIGFHLVIMGFPEQDYRRKAEAMKLSGFITFTGRIDYQDASLLLSAGDVAVSPKISATEANGKLLNYMACGLPVVVFDTPVNRELLGDDGVYATFGDAGDLACRIADLLRDKERLQLLGQRLRQRAIELHGWDRRARQLATLYRQLLEVAKK